MGATNHTPSLNLPQFIGTDKPTWLGDINNAFRNIDNGFGNLKTVTSSVISGQIKLLDTLVAKHTDDILANATDIAANTSSISSMNMRLTNVEADVSTLDRREATHYTDVVNKIDGLENDFTNLEDDITYIERNMDKIERDLLVNTATVAAVKMQISNLDVKVDTFDNRITDNKTDIDNLRTETDILRDKADDASADITQLRTDVNANTSSISSLDSRIVTLETLPPKVSKNETDIAALQADVNANTSGISDNETAIQALQTKTANITDGVTVLFSFAIDASGNRGFVLPNGTVQAFFTDAEWQALENDINNNMGDISDLQTKVSGITSGMRLPYSLGIAPGGAYGYIKNGETGVTPFVTEEDVNKIVDLQPIEADVQNLQTNVSALRTDVNTNTSNISDTETAIQALQRKTANIADGVIVERPVMASGQDTKLKMGSDTLTFSGAARNVNYFLRIGMERDEGGPDRTITIPFSFGVDSSGRYGYKKAGADTVIPFLNNAEFKGFTTTASSNPLNIGQTAGAILPSQIARKRFKIGFKVKPANSVVRLMENGSNFIEITLTLTKYNKNEYANIIGLLWPSDDSWNLVNTVRGPITSLTYMADDGNLTRLPAVIYTEDGNMFII